MQEELIDQGRAVEWHALDTFADAITIVEYYLEQFDGDTANQQEDVLAAAEESILALLESRSVEPTIELDKELYAEPEEILEELSALQDSQDSDEEIIHKKLVDSPEPSRSPAPDGLELKTARSIKSQEDQTLMMRLLKYLLKRPKRF